MDDGQGSADWHIERLRLAIRDAEIPREPVEAHIDMARRARNLAEPGGVARVEKQSPSLGDKLGRGIRERQRGDDGERGRIDGGKAARETVEDVEASARFIEREAGRAFAESKVSMATVGRHEVSSRPLVALVGDYSPEILPHSPKAGRRCRITGAFPSWTNTGRGGRCWKASPPRGPSPFGSSTQTDDGNERTVTDLNAAGAGKFYRVEIMKP